MRLNTYAAYCKNCGVWVDEETGVLLELSNPKRYITRCKPCYDKEIKQAQDQWISLLEINGV